MKKLFFAVLALVIANFLLAGNLSAKENNTQKAKAALIQTQFGRSLAKSNKESSRDFAEMYVKGKDAEFRALVSTLAISVLNRSSRNAFMMFVDSYNSGIKFVPEKFFDIADDIHNDFVFSYCDLQEEISNEYLDSYMPKTNTLAAWKSSLIKAIQDKMPMCYYEYLANGYENKFMEENSQKELEQKLQQMDKGLKK